MLDIFFMKLLTKLNFCANILYYCFLLCLCLAGLSLKNLKNFTF